MSKVVINCGGVQIEVEDSERRASELAPIATELHEKVTRPPATREKPVGFGA